MNNVNRVNANPVPAVSAELRRQAEERLLEKTNELPPSLTGETTQRLVHELEVHQIELEMQNTELRQTRDELETALEKYTDLYDIAPVGYCNLDHDGVVGVVNLTAASLLGVERSRLIGRRFGQFVVDEYRQLFTEFLGKVFARLGNKESCEIWLATERNSKIFVRIEAFACMSGQECRVGVIDLTERRRAENALDETRKELEELNCSLEERIARAVEDLRRKDQMLILQDRRAAMGEMINNIAHQWRQPLNMLGLYIQELPLVYDGGSFSKEFLEDNVLKSMEVIQQMSRTIDDFRNFFRPDKMIVAFSLNQVVARTLSLFDKSFQEQQINIILDPDGDPIANGYPNEYSQVLLNILMNARDALLEKDGGDATIVIRAFAEGGRSVVTVSDNAGGVPEEIIDRIFDPYFTTRGPDKGTGIGLFMSKTIIEKNMNGHLTVRNTGAGAEFRIEV